MWIGKKKLLYSYLVANHSVDTWAMHPYVFANQKFTECLIHLLIDKVNIYITYPCAYDTKVSFTFENGVTKKLVSYHHKLGFWGLIFKKCGVFKTIDNYLPKPMLIMFLVEEKVMEGFFVGHLENEVEP